MVVSRPRPASTHLRRIRGVDAFKVDPTIMEADWGESGCLEHTQRADEMLICERSFLHYLRHWRFKNRETGDVISFRTLWDGQRRFAELMEVEPRIVALKAGKLGFSEIECAFDGWVARYRHANARVHIFSKDSMAARDMLKVARFGIMHLPEYMQLPIVTDTARELALFGARDDERQLVAYASTEDPAIDQSAAHSHVDEIARMPWPQTTYAAIESTVPAGGSMHTLSRGNGDDNFLADLWEQAAEPGSTTKRIFARWDERPRTPEGEVGEGEDPQRLWYEEQRASMPTTTQLYYYAPRTPEEALTGDLEDAFVDIALWDRCFDPELPTLMPGDPTPVVLSLDAGVTKDLFGAALISRHPVHKDQPALRAHRAWKPPKGGQIDYILIENWIRLVCLGGCVRGHANPRPGVLSAHVHELSCALCTSLELKLPIGPCETCVNRADAIPAYNVVQVCYDPYQLVNMMQRLRRDRVAWCRAFDQNKARLLADTDLKQRLTERSFWHGSNPEHREEVRLHFEGAKAKIPAGEDRRIRMEKRTARSKIDLAVAVSMGVREIMRLSLGLRADRSG